MSDVDFKVGANANEATAELDKVAQKAMSTGQRMQSSMREASYNMAKGFKDSVSNINNEFEKIDKLAKKVQSSFILIGAVITAGMSVTKIIETASEFELLEIRLNSVMGSAKAGEQAFEWIKQFAATTPSSVKQVTDAFMTLKNFGLDPMDGTLQKVSDASAKYGKDADTAQRAALALGQAWARGKLQGQDTLQMIDAGIPVYDLLSKATGKTAAEIQKMSEKGTMGRDVIRQLIDQMGQEGAGAAAEKMKSYAGAVSNMGDTFANAIDTLRKKGGFDFITQSILNFTRIIPSVVNVVGEGMAAIGDIIKALWGVVSDVFSAIGGIINAVFGNGGDALTGMELFVNMLKVVQVALIGFRTGFQVIFQSIKFILAELAGWLVAIATTANKALRLDLSGAQAAWRQGASDMRGMVSQHFDDLVDISQKGQDDINNVLLGATKPAALPGNTAIKPTGISESSTTAKSASRLGDWDAKLAEMRDAYEKQKTEQGSFEEFGKSRERDYWKNILNTVKLSTDERRQVSTKYYTLERELRKAAFESEIAELRTQMNALREGSVERIQLAGEIAQKAGEKYGIESKEYKAALEEMSQMARARAKQQEQLDALALDRTRAHQMGLIDLERVRIEESAALGDITEAQKLAALGKLKDQEFQIELQAATERAALLIDDVVTYQQAMDKILEIKRKHELDKTKVEADIKVANKKEKDDQFAPFEKAFEKSINGIIAGTTTLRQAMRNLTQSIALEFANMGVKMAVHWAANQLRMTLAAAAGAQARVGIETAASAQSIALGATASLKNIMNNAYSAASAAYQAVVGIPVVGPFLAPVAAGVAFAATAAFGGSVASAEGGYDIPAGMNPMTQLHEREMVLPKQQADTIRDMANGSGGGNFYFNGTGGDFIHKNDLAKMLKQMNRNFVQIK